MATCLPASLVRLPASSDQVTPKRRGPALQPPSPSHPPHHTPSPSHTSPPTSTYTATLDTCTNECTYTVQCTHTRSAHTQYDAHTQYSVHTQYDAHTQLRSAVGAGALSSLMRRVSEVLVEITTAVGEAAEHAMSTAVAVAALQRKIEVLPRCTCAAARQRQIEVKLPFMVCSGRLRSALLSGRWYTSLT